MPAKKEFPTNPSLELQQALVLRPETNPTGYVPLENATAHPFEPTAASWSRVNAWWLAEASWLAYSREPETVKRVFARNAGVSSCRSIAHGGTECFLAHDERFAIVAFRGTQPDDWEDLFNISRVAPCRWDVGLVHHGFADALDRVWPTLQSALDALPGSCPVWFTGHSLGGALAALAAVRRGSRAAGLYTIGSPRVGDAAFAAHVGNLLGERSIRYANDHDIVPHVPPRPFAFPGLYTHVERLRWIAPDGHIGSMRPTLEHFVEEIFGRNTRMFLDLIELSKQRVPIAMPDTLTDHTPLYYVLHAWNDFAVHG